MFVSGNEEIECGSCGILLKRNSASYRHVYFHAWLVNLYLQGLEYQKENNLPNCKLTSGLNFVPDFPTEFTCNWDKCRFQTNDVSSFYSHVSQHPQVCLIILFIFCLHLVSIM